MGRYGLIGTNIKHSLSPRIHQLYFDKLKLDHTYDLIEINQLKDLDLSNYDGFNITMPYKLEISKFLGLNRMIANTYDKKKNELFNSDVFGFKYLLKHYEIDFNDKNVVVLGSGQTAQMIEASIGDECHVQLISRSVGDYDNLDLFKGDILINASPQGLNDDFPLLVTKNHLKDFGVVIDLLYKPFRTPLLMLADELNINHHNGLMMLVAQAIMSESIWNNHELNEHLIDEIYYQILLEEINISLVGLPGVGKSTFSNCFNSVVSIDDEIEKKGKLIKDIFKNEGEAYFRRLEHEEIVRASKLKGNVIDLGAGAIEDENNIKVLKKNSFIVYLKREKEDILKSLDTSNRPMFSKTSFDDLVNRRLPLYELHSDFVLNIESISKSYEKLIERMRKL